MIPASIAGKRLTAVCLCVLLLPVTAAAADEAQVVRNLLDRMSNAMENMDYRGVFVYRHGDELETIRIIHRSTPRGEQERLVSLNGAPREVIRTDELVRCIFPDKGAVVVDRRMSQSLFPTLPPSQAEHLTAHYRFNLVGKGRIAGLDATIISITPRDKYRYGYRLWLEEDTGMLLKSEMVSPDGEVVETLMFTTIDIGGNVSLTAMVPEFIPSQIQFSPMPPKSGPRTRIRQARVRANKEFSWYAGDLPDGFRMKRHQWERMDAGAPLAEHLIFTDGLASVSVYVEQADQVSTPAPAGLSRMGAVSAYIRKLENFRITVVGEVPPVTVKTIAAGIHRRGSAVAADD